MLNGYFYNSSSSCSLYTDFRRDQHHDLYSTFTIIKEIEVSLEVMATREKAKVMGLLSYVIIGIEMGKLFSWKLDVSLQHNFDITKRSNYSKEIIANKLFYAKIRALRK